ncbi:MAG: winged helix-turn-helix transcriptional regulator [Erythrobacter sp.]|nr:winged helix-turn-helix transcriptional regulator [Erythrobacter sp.]NCQ63772.1 winged helix-turn-helix transcriptional regulator [Alphaproteobacteria bacterium]
MLQGESRSAAFNSGPSYSAPCDPAGLPVAISVFSDRPYVRSEMSADAQLAGFRIAQSEAVLALEDGTARALGDIVVVDVPAADASTLALLERLAQRIAQAGSRLIVSTAIGALEPVLVASRACDPVLLVEPRRAERLVAFGEAVASLAGRRVRELSGEDRVAVMQLVERVSALAGKLDGLLGNGAAPAGGGSAFAFGDGQRHAPEETAEPLAGTPGLPDPRRVRATIRKRQMRARFFDAALFADPAWDILLDLTAARAEGRRVSVTSLCIASGVPPTTALRWISQMTEHGLLQREEDMVDRRRAFVSLSDTAVEAMAQYFDTAGACECAGV